MKTLTLLSVLTLVFSGCQAGDRTSEDNQTQKSQYKKGVPTDTRCIRIVTINHQKYCTNGISLTLIKEER